MNRTISLRALAVAWTALTALPFVVFYPRLPEPMASQWGLGAAPDSALPRLVVLATLVALALAGTTVCLRRLRNIPAAPGEIAPGVGVGVFLGSLASLLAWTVVMANLDAPSWLEAAPVGLPIVLGALVASGALASQARRLAARLEVAEPTAAGPAHSAGLSAHERAVYYGRTESVGFRAGAWIAFLLAIALAAFGRSEAALVSVLVGVVFVPFTSLSIRADRRGLRVAYGPLGFPRQTFSIDEIEQADVVSVRPMNHGGWGYRGSLLLMGRATVVLRGGVALELTLTGGRRWTVTCEKPDIIAGLLQDMIRHG